MAAGLELLVVFWTGWGIHLMVVLSFALQVTLLLASGFRRRKDNVLLKVLIWSAYMLADTTAIYTLGHMSVLCNWSPEKQLMALWAPLLLVHLGGQDNITAYAIEDNRLWLRHLQTFVLQVAAAVYVLHVSSIIWRPMSSKVRLAAILMFVVGILKYGERIWALMRADSCASSSLSATSYDKVSVSRTTGDQSSDFSLPRDTPPTDDTVLIMAYSLLDVPKQMFEGPTSYVQINNHNKQAYEAEYIFAVVRMQLSMMYDLLYTKAAVVHTWYGLCSRVLISLPFTIVALALVCVAVTEGLDSNKRADVGITKALLVGAVILETMSVLRAIFSKWTQVLLYTRGRRWISIGNGRSLRAIFGFERLFAGTRFERVLLTSRGSKAYWSGHMRQHSLFKLASHSGISRGSQMAKRIGVEDWWDSNVDSWSTEVPSLAIRKVLELVSTTQDITKSQGLNAIRRTSTNSKLAAWIWTEEELKLEERILVWHIATHVYIWWYRQQRELVKSMGYSSGIIIDVGDNRAIFELMVAAEVVANYMFFLLAARPYMLPYPVSRQAYVQLCSDAFTHLRSYCYEETTLVQAILDQKADLLKGAPFCIGLRILRRGNGGGGTGAAAQHQHQPSSINTTMDRGCQLAAKLIHITDVLRMPKRSGKEEQRDQKGKRIVDGNEDTITEQETAYIIDGTAVLNMVLEVWVEMLCYTAHLCNENYHAKHLTNGGEIMTIITLLIIYTKNGFIRTNASTSTSTSGGTPWRKAVAKARQEEEARRLAALEEEEKERKRERARRAKAALEENPDALRKGKWPRCTQ